MRRPKCTPNAQTDGGDRSLGMIYLPDKIDLNMARNTCSNLAQIDLTLGVWRVWRSTFWSHGRAVDPSRERDILIDVSDRITSLAPGSNLYLLTVQP